MTSDYLMLYIFCIATPTISVNIQQIGMPSNQVPASPPGSQKSKEGKRWHYFGIASSMLIILTLFGS